ncbi:MAG: isoprenylcysteine carboxylmethyltransferase family protein [Deferribacterales bacterium]
MTALYAYLIFYCILHSVLADRKLIGRVYGLWWYRFFYVIQSVVLLIPYPFLYMSINHTPFFNPPLFGKILLGIIWFSGLFFGLYASKSYDNGMFLGLSHIKARIRGERQPENPKELKTSGALAVVRHPYYTAGLILIWARPMNMTDFVITLILTVYFIFGYINEERKLIKEFGQDYIEYRKKVPALIPKIGFRNEK